MPPLAPSSTMPVGEWPLMASLGLDHLTVSQRLTLAQEILASLAAEQMDSQLTPELAAELDRRVQDDDANPDDVVPWSEVKREIRARLAGGT
jgi:putative addiction module component (TIGR02574 family)